MIDRYALITGASSGIGAEFARQLAAQGVHLALVGRSEARLTPVAEEIRAAYPVAVETLAADLGGAQGVERVITFIEALPHLDYLVNNAGYGTTGYFAIKNIPDAKANSYDEIGLAMEDLFNGRIDGVVCDDPVAVQYALMQEEYKAKLKDIKK